MVEAYLARSAAELRGLATATAAGMHKPEDIERIIKTPTPEVEDSEWEDSKWWADKKPD